MSTKKKSFEKTKKTSDFMLEERKDADEKKRRNKEEVKEG